MLRILSLALIVLFSACGPTEKGSPVAYNDSLVVQQMKVAEASDRMLEVLDTYVKEDMETVYGRFTEAIEKALERTEALGAYGEDDTFRQATLSYLNTFKDLASNQYREALQLLSKGDSAYTPVDEKRIELLYKEIDARSAKVTEACREAQEAFARKYNLQLNP
jgi:hypothetical protein